MRVRGFAREDAHICCAQDQMAEECLKIDELILSVCTVFILLSQTASCRTAGWRVLLRCTRRAAILAAT